MATAFLAAQALDERRDRRIRLYAAAAEMDFGEAANMAAPQAFDFHFVTHMTGHNTISKTRINP